MKKLCLMTMMIMMMMMTMETLLVFLNVQVVNLATYRQFANAA